MEGLTNQNLPAFFTYHKLILFFSWLLVSFSMAIVMRHFKLVWAKCYVFHISGAIYLLTITLILPIIALSLLDKYSEVHFPFGIIGIVVCFLQVGGGLSLFFLRKTSLLSPAMLKLFRIVHMCEGYLLILLILIQGHIGICTDINTEGLKYIYGGVYILYLCLFLIFDWIYKDEAKTINKEITTDAVKDADENSNIQPLMFAGGADILSGDMDEEKEKKPSKLPKNIPSRARIIFSVPEEKAEEVKKVQEDAVIRLESKLPTRGEEIKENSAMPTIENRDIIPGESNMNLTERVISSEKERLTKEEEKGDQQVRNIATIPLLSPPALEAQKKEINPPSGAIEKVSISEKNLTTEKAATVASPSKAPLREEEKGVRQELPIDQSSTKKEAAKGKLPRDIKVIFQDEIDKKIKEGKCIAYYEDYVIDITSWADIHPGGADAIKSMVGNDISRLMLGDYKFKGSSHKHSTKAMSQIENYIIGKRSNSLSSTIFIGIDPTTSVDEALWKIAKKEPVNEKMSILSLSHDAIRVLPQNGSIGSFGKYFSIKSKSQGISRYFFSIFCLHQKMIEAHIELSKRVQKEEKEYKAPYAAINSTQSSSLDIIVKNCGEFTNWLSKEAKTGVPDFQVRGPFGEGLNVLSEDKGLHIGIVFLSGELFFLDIAAYLLRLNAYRISAGKGTPLKLFADEPLTSLSNDSFKLVLIVFCHDKAEIYGDKLFSELTALTRLAELGNFEYYPVVSEWNEGIAKKHIKSHARSIYYFTPDSVEEELKGIVKSKGIEPSLMHKI